MNSKFKLIAGSVLAVGLLAGCTTDKGSTDNDTEKVGVQVPEKEAGEGQDKVGGGVSLTNESVVNLDDVKKLSNYIEYEKIKDLKVGSTLEEVEKALSGIDKENYFITMESIEPVQTQVYVTTINNELKTNFNYIIQENKVVIVRESITLDTDKEVEKAYEVVVKDVSKEFGDFDNKNIRKNDLFEGDQIETITWNLKDTVKFIDRKQIDKDKFEISIYEESNIFRENMNKKFMKDEVKGEKSETPENETKTLEKTEEKAVEGK